MRDGTRGLIVDGFPSISIMSKDVAAAHHINLVHISGNWKLDKLNLQSVCCAERAILEQRARNA